jgi:hypothetical protein
MAEVGQRLRGNMIAWLAFGISAATFVWKFVETYIRWPRIGVVIRQSITIHVGFIPSAEAFGTPRVTREGDEIPAQIENTSEEPDQEPSPPAPATRRPEDTFHVIVVNKGAEPTTIANLGLRSEDRSRTIDVQRERDSGKHIEGPDLPVRIEAHGALQWTIEHELVKDFPRGTKVVGFAFRYRSFRKYPKRWRNPLKLYETPITYQKN